MNIEDHDIKFDFLAMFGPGYLLGNSIVGLFTDNSFVFQFIWTLIDVILLVIILKRECGNYFLLAFAFLVPFFDGVQINLWRNIKSILIFFWAVQYIRDRKLIKYTIAIIVAASFHVTAFLYLPLYFIINKSFLKVHFGIAVFCIVFCFVGIAFFYDYLTLATAVIGGKVDSMAIKYTEDGRLSGGITIGLLYRIMLLILLLLYYKRLNIKNLLILNTALFYLETAVCFNSLLVFRDRFSVLFVIGIVCIMPYLNEAVNSNRFKRIILSLNFILMFGYVHIQHVTKVAQYENLLLGISERNQAEKRIFEDVVDLGRDE